MTTSLGNKGFSLVLVLFLSLIVFTIAGAGIYIATIGSKSTHADKRSNLAEKSANAGLLKAVDDVNKRGFCQDDSLTGSLGTAEYSVKVRRSGRNCFIRSTGTVGPAKVVRSSIIQSYYGVGVYTVRGSVSASIGSGARLSGCDRSVSPTCFVPAFIASGTVSTSLPQRTCVQDGGGDGLYGNPALLPGVRFTDLIPLFFNVNCFNTHAVSGCDLGLLDVFEGEYGRNPVDNSQDVAFGNQWGVPVVTIAPLPSVPNSPSCTFPTNPAMGGSQTINLSTTLTGCSEIIIRNSVSDITIQGARGGSRVRVYLDGNATTPIVSGASNLTLYTTRTNRSLTVSNSSDFRVYTQNASTFNNTNSNFVLYTTNTTTLNGTVGTSNQNVPPFTITSNSTVTAGAGASLTRGTIRTGPASVNDTNSVSAPQNFQTNGNVTLDNVNLFARRLSFANNSTVYILDSLVYVYAYACPNCSRTTNTSSLNACDGDTRWCGWYGSGVRLNVGRDSAGNARPTLFITNNTTVRADSASGTVYIWGAFVGEDVTYLRWSGGTDRNYRGFLVRNFPYDLTLTINMGDDTAMAFSQPVLNDLSDRYWFFRRVECVRDDVSPWTQMIQTRMTAY